MSFRIAALAAVLLAAATPSLAQTSPPQAAFGGVSATLYMPVYVTNGPVPGVGGAIGFGFSPGRLFVGGEVTATYSFFDTPDIDLVGRARLGFVIGGEFLAYGALGFGHYWDGEGGGFNYIKASMGGELAVTSRVAIRSEASAFRYEPGVIEYGVAGGIVFRFGH